MAWKLPFNNPGKAIVAILLVISLFVAYKAKATEVEVGPTYTGEFNGGIALTLSERILDDKLDIGVALIGPQSWEQVNIDHNANFWFAYVAKKPETWIVGLPDEVHLGGGVWFKTQSPINGCYPTFLMGLKWRLGDHASIGIRHWSNAGVCSPNRGQDLLTFGWRF